jgi:predicted dinucleotide-binding enzyme
MGGALTRRLTALGHHARVANSRGPETLQDPREPNRRHGCDAG